MTEEEWLTGSEAADLVFEVKDLVSDRKVRLLAVACARRVNHLLWAGWHSYLAIDIAEDYADGIGTREQLEAGQRGVVGKLELYPGEPVYDASFWACSVDINGDVGCSLFYAANVSTRPFSEDDEAARVREAEVGQQTRLLRCIFGNPFRPVTFAPAWRTETALALATGIYEDRAFDRLPILADALEEAGCDVADVLTHCRGPGPHARGCWVVDGVLGKT
jgi:hypothetical protein